MFCVGIDPAWQIDRNHSAVAIGRLALGRLHVETVSVSLYSLEDILQFLDRAIPSDSDAVVGIDAPLIITNEGGIRPCEREVSRRFGRFHAGAHSTNLKRYPDAGSVRLARALERRGFTMSADPRDARQREGRLFFETYPHPAHVVLFNRERIIKYKKGRVAVRRAGLKEYAGEIELKLGTAVPVLDVTPQVRCLLDAHVDGLRGKALKAHEDRLDALFCAYLAAHYWYWGDERNQGIGSAFEGSIVVPTHTWEERIWLPYAAPVSRENARRSAEAFLTRSDMQLGGSTIRAVHASHEVGRPPSIYELTRPLDECWIAYVDRPAIGPRSSIVVLVSMLDGKVIYAGSANDEG